jgi:hypothetical protein
MTAPKISPAIKTLRALVLADLQRSMSSNFGSGHPVWVLELCWNGIWSAVFNLGNLERLLTPGMALNEASVRVRVVTEVVLLPESEEALVASCESFLRRPVSPGNLQDRILHAHAWVTNIEKELTAQMPTNHPHECAKILAKSFVQNRAAIIGTVIHSVLTLSSAHTPTIDGKQKVAECYVEEPLRDRDQPQLSDISVSTPGTRKVGKPPSEIVQKAAQYIGQHPEIVVRLLDPETRPSALMEISREAAGTKQHERVPKVLANWAGRNYPARRKKPTHRSTD